MQGNTWKKALAVLSGVAMIGTVGAVVAPASAEENPTCQVGDTSGWLESDNSYENFKKCLERYRGATSGTYTIQLLNNVTANDNYPDSDSNFKSTEINNANVPLTIESNGDVQDLQYFHFAVTGGASLTLSHVKVDDALAQFSNYSSEIPVFVGSDDASKPSTFTLDNGASLLTDNGEGRGYAIVAGSNSVVNLNSGAEPGTTPAVRGSSAAVVTSNDSSATITKEVASEPVTNATININAGDIVNENSQNPATYAVNVNGADVNLNDIGNPRVQEVYVNNGTFTQNGGRVWPNLDNVYGWFGSDSSVQYPLSLEGNAQAFVSGGTLTGNYKNDQGQQGKAVLLSSANAKFNVRADERVELGGYDESAKNFGAADPHTGTVVNKGAGFAAPTQNGAGSAAPTQNAAGFSADYTSTGLSNSIKGSDLRAFPAQDGENKDTTFDLKSEAARGTAQDAASLAGTMVENNNKVRADYSPLHGAQFVYAVRAFQNQDSYVASSDASIAHQVYVYGTPAYVGSYNYYDGSNGNPATDANFPKASANGLFAGWYNTEKLTTPVTTFPGTTKYPFGYFVSNDTQNVLVQRNAGNGKTFTLRFLYGVPKADALTNYDFTVKLTNTDDTSYTFPLKSTVYYSTASFIENGADNRKTPAKSGFNLGDAQYFAAGYIYGVPEAWKNAKVTVTPQWTTADGTQVTRGTTSDVALPTTANDNKQVVYVE